MDHQFQLAGFDKKRLFYTQGDYGLWQCSKPCHQETYDNEEAVRRMVYALVNTLGGLEQIDAVRLLAEGEALDALGGVPLEQPIVPDTSLERD